MHLVDYLAYSLGFITIPLIIVASITFLTRPWGVMVPSRTHRVLSRLLRCCLWYVAVACVLIAVILITRLLTGASV